MKTTHNITKNKFLKIAAFTALSFLSVMQAKAQVIWSSAGGAVWLTGSNWTGGAYPTSTQVAQFNANPTAGTGVGIDMNGSTNNGANNQAAGAVYVSASRTAAMIVGNSSTASNGTLTLSGATVNGTANVAIANFGINGATRQTLTLQNIQGGGNKTMEVALSGATNITTGTGASSTLIGNTIIITSVISGTGPTFLGGGTYDGGSGVLGGLLRLGAANTFTGGITVGSASSTYSSGILQLDNKAAINNVSGNNITINPFSELFLNSTSTDTFNTSNLTLNLNGNGNNATNTVVGGALVTGSNKSFTWTGPVNLASDARISNIGTATLTVSGAVSGSGTLIKTGSSGLGVLSLTGANTSTGGTKVIAGSVIAGSGSGIGTGLIVMAGATTAFNTAITLNNPAQTVTGISSNFSTSSGTITQTVSLSSATVLTLNMSSDYTYGAGDVPTLTSIISGAGKLIKNGSGRLTLSGKGSFLTGGLMLNAGEIRFNPSGTMTMSAPDTMNGGTFSTIGDTAVTFPTVTLGTLNLADNSTIALGNSVVHTLKFAASNTIPWTAGKMLTITGWNGTWGAGTTGSLGRLQVGTTGSGLTVTQIAQIQFLDGSGHYFPAQQLSNGEVVPKNPTITTTIASFGPFYNTASHTISVAFTTSVGTFYSNFKVQLSDTTGAFTADTTTGILDSGLTSPIAATIPAGILTGNYRVRVINGNPLSFGNDNGSDIAILTFPPVITGVSPASAKPGDTITLTGSNFSGTPSNNTVYFGATKGVAVSGSTTSLNVVVPLGAIHAPISLETPAILFGYSKYPFMPTFTSSYFMTSSFNLKPKVDFSTGTGPNTAIIGDLDGDGKSDLVIPNTNAGSGNTITLYRNTSTTGTINSGSFTSAGTISTGAGPSNAQLMDLDGDGKLDIAVTSLGSGSISVFRNTSSSGSISFASRGNVSTISTGVIGAQPYEVTITDFDGDGKPDLASTSPYTGASNSTISVMRNVSSLGTLSSSSFATAVSFNTPASLGAHSTPIGIVAADFDGDGKPDFAVACTSAASIAVYRNTATAGVINSGSFATPQVFSAGISGSNPIDVQAGDIDGDGKPDIVFTNSGTNKIGVLRNTSSSGSISFATVAQFTTGSAPTGLSLADVNGDGKLDVAAANAGGNTVSLFRNTSSSGSVSFATKSDYSVGTTPFGVNMGDLDNDGYPDIVTGNNGSDNISIIKNYPLPQVAAITGTATVCGGGGTTTLSDATTGGYWSISNPARATIDTAGVVTGITSGTDTVYYTVVAGGDTNFVSRTITVNAAPSVAAISGPSSVCPGSNISLTDATPLGTWGMTNGNATISGTGTVTGVTPGLDTATYTVTNVSGCSTTAKKQITISAPVTAGAITGSGTVCTGGSTPLADTIAGGVWTSSNTSIASVNSATGMVYGISVGSATITYTVTGSCNTATTTAAITVNTVPPTPGPISGTTNLCSGATTTLTDTTAGGSWGTSNGTVASINTSTGMVYAISPGTATITYFKSNSCGSSYVTVPFNVYSTLTAAIVSAAAPCEGYMTNIVFNGTSGARLKYRIDGGSLLDTILAGGTFTLPTVAMTTPHTYTLYSVYNVACSLTIDSTITVTPTPMVWVGGAAGVETDWNIGQNWSCSFVPGAGDNVLIPSGTTYSPVIAASASGTTKSLTIASGATVNVGAAGSLNIKGTFANNGSVNGAGKVVLNNTTAQAIGGIGTVTNLELNNTAGATVNSGARLTVNNTLTITAGTLATGDSVVLASYSATTARIAAIPASGSAITGNVKVMQYIQGGYRRYRFWSHPFSNYIPLSQLENYIDITGAGGAANGFTTTASNAPSAFRYDPLVGNSTLGSDPGWKPFSSAYGTPDSNRLHQYQGIRIFVRGAKGEGLGYGSYTPSPVTVGMWGAVNQGTQTVHLAKGAGTGQDYNMVGNPYPSPVDIGAVIYNASLAGNITGSAFYVFNPSLGAAGQFQSVPISSSPYYLQANCAFQVRAAHNDDTLHFTESNKSATITTQLLKTAPAYTSLVIYDANYHAWDMLYVQFNEQATINEDAKFDAVKLQGSDFNFYSLTADSKKLAIDARPFAAGQSVPLGISSGYAQEYIIKAEGMAVPEGKQMFLHDKLLRQYIPLQQGTEYKFGITADKATQGEARFELTFDNTTAATEIRPMSVTMNPNPATDEVNLKIQTSGSNNIAIRILDITGVAVYNTTAKATANGSIKIPVAKFASGVYMVEVSSGDEKTVQRLIKE